MKRFPAILALAALAAFGLAAGLATTGLAADPDPPNQGDPDKVLTVPSGYTCAGTAVPGAKQGDNAGLGPTITVSATAPIVRVTIKSGSKAELVSATWSPDYLSATITISQDVSNYVVWTCSDTTTTTTETTPTETTPTTTETTPTTTETTPTVTTAETTPTVPAAPFTPPQAPAKPVAKPVGGVAGVQTQPARPKTPLLPPTPTAPVTRTAAGANAPTQPELAYTP